MRFMIVVKATEESEAGVMPSEEMIAEMATYHEELAEAGVLVDGSGLQPTSKGWRITYSGGERTVTDGGASECDAGPRDHRPSPPRRLDLGLRGREHQEQCEADDEDADQRQGDDDRAP